MNSLPKNKIIDLSSGMPTREARRESERSEAIQIYAEWLRENPYWEQVQLGQLRAFEDKLKQEKARKDAKRHSIWHPQQWLNGVLRLLND